MTAYHPAVLLAAASAATPDPWQVVASALAPLGTLAGALVGWLAATRTAQRNASLARQDEQRRWNHERREKAYVALLGCRNELVRVRWQWDQRDPDQLDLATLKEYVHDVADAEAALDTALAVVELVGSPAAVELSRRWARTLSTPPHAAPLQGHREEITPPGEPSRGEAGEFRDPFVALIRQELGADD